MMTQTVIDLCKKCLAHTLLWLDAIEKQTPRLQKRPWYRTEIHIPPVIVGVVSAVIITTAISFSLDLSFTQILAMSLFILILMGLFIFYLIKDHADLAKNDDAMALLSVSIITTLFWIVGITFLSHQFKWVSPYLTPVCIAPLLTALLLHQRMAVVVAVVTAIICGISNGFSLPLALFGTIGGVMAVAAGSRSRTSHDVSRTGFYVGVIQMATVVFLAVSLKWDKPTTLVAALSAFGSGFLAAFFCLGALPFLESFFSRTSNLRLLGLADVNHPLLKKMSLEAPGTYHHSLIVASMAEDAANAIGANGLLCRVGAYFHDIGKIVKSEYFIENQGTFPNPHDQVSPSLSKLVITSHIKEGVALAQQHKLDQQVVDFIPQHHGTSQIEYFYRKALELKEEAEQDQLEVNEETYRYPGPKPQTKESGIVMMADSVEAASRSLEEPNHQRFQDLAYKIINKKLFDGQLDETSLTLKDLHTVAERFTQTLTTLHHARVAYPDAGSSLPKGREDELSPQ